MAVWQYPLAIVPSEAVKELPTARAQDFVATFATPDGADFSPLWQFRQQPVEEIVLTIQKFLKPGKEVGGQLVFGSPKRLQIFLQQVDGEVRDLVCKIDVRAVADVRVILTEILQIAKAHQLTGMNEDYGVIPLSDAFHLLRSISQSRAVRYVRDPEGYINRIHETYKLPDPKHETGAPVTGPEEGHTDEAGAPPPAEESNAAT
jgi:hypothetical protein